MGVLAATIAALQAAATCPYDAGVTAQAQAQSDIAAALQYASSVDGVAPTYPAWRQGMPLRQWSPISSTGNLRQLLNDDPWAGNIDADCSICVDEFGNVWVLVPGGHATNAFGGFRNINLCVPLLRDSPQVLQVTQPSPRAAVYDDSVSPAVPWYPGGPRYRDGLPVTRHLYGTMHPVSAAHSPDGLPRILLVTCYAGIFDGFTNAAGQPYWHSGPQVESFRPFDNTWDPPGFFPDFPAAAWMNTTGTFARDPRDGAIYGHFQDSATAGRLYKLVPQTRSWVAVPTTPIYPSKQRLGGSARAYSIIDVLRNRLVTALQSQYTENGWALRFVDLASGQVSWKPITGSLATPGAKTGAQLVHDLDADRYLYPDYALGADRLTVASTMLHAVDPDTAASTALAPFALPTVDVDARMAYVGALGGVVYWPRANQALQFYPTR